MRQFRLSTEQFRAHQNKLREEAVNKEFNRLRRVVYKNQKIIRIQGILLALFSLLCLYLWIN